LVSAIDTERMHGNLSSAIRLFVLDHYREKTAAAAVDNKPSRDMIGIRASASALRAE
jgi:hypothetical protein